MSAKKNSTVQKEPSIAAELAGSEPIEQRQRIRWNLSMVQIEAKKYSHRADFKARSPKAYSAAQRMAILDVVCSHMTRRAPKIKWTFEACRAEALKYSSRRDFEVGSSSAYCMAGRKGWKDIICTHMDVYIKYSDREIISKAANYRTRKEFATYANPYYQSALRRGILEQACGNMELGCMPPGHWSYDRNEKEALKYDTRIAYKTKSQVSYEAARIGGYLDDICQHMEMNRHLSDIVYIWEIASMEINVPAYKIGVTSSNQKYKTRANSASKSMGVSVGWYAQFHADDALEVEKKCLSFGARVDNLTGSGSTEVRALLPHELMEILEIMKNA